MPQRGIALIHAITWAPVKQFLWAHAFTCFAVLLIAAGVFLRTWQYWANRSLWFDEALLANNLIPRSLAGLLSGLNNGQVAPPGFLILEKAIITTIGPSEYALRLLPFVGGIFGTILMWTFATACFSRLASLLALSAFVVSERLIYYSSELKPYSTDVMWCLLLLISSVKSLQTGLQPRAVLAFGFVSAIAVWFSYPSIFIITACCVALSAGACANRSIHGSRLNVILWIAASATLPALSFLFLRRFMTFDAQLFNYWNHAFMPSAPLEQPAWAARALYGFLNDPMGLYWFEVPDSVANRLVAIVAGALLGVGMLSLLFRRWVVALMLALPFAFAVLASAFRKYPFEGRLLLFALPLAMLLLAEGIERTAHWFRRPGASTAVSMVLIAVLLSRIIVVDWRNVLQPVLQPVMGTHIRPAMAYLGARSLPDDIIYSGYVESEIRPAFDYYARMYKFPRTTLSRPDDLMRSAELNRQGDAMISNAQRLWVVVIRKSDPNRADDDESRLRTLESSKALRTDAFKSKNASVYLYEFPY